MKCTRALTFAIFFLLLVCEGLEQIHGHTESGVKYSQGSLLHRQPLSGCPYHYALIISVAFYKQKFRLFNSDRQPRASALGRVLREPLLAGYPLENVMALTDEEATKEAIEAAIERLRTSTSSNCTIFFYFDGAAAEIATGPEAGYYLCPYDYDPSDRKGSSITCFTGHGATAGGYLLETIENWPAGNVLFCISTCTPDTLDRDVTVGSPYFREKFIEKVHALQGRAIFSGCKMDEPTYTGIFANLIFNAMAGVREEDSDIDNQFYARMASDGNAMFSFNLLDYLRRHMHRQIPAEYKSDPRMHPFLSLNEGDNFVLSRRSHPTRFPMEIKKRRAELGILEVLRGLDVEQGAK